ncbi:ABC transporter permease [Capsulimonas corticalis]|uniref:ABC transporter permease n=1 Tax=Capsulimonas corticalis TaxID=2219043 RepID=A0A402CV29_9BACT|nr:ABC transporter permease subunit [Capsulimonas corticalis]BDI30254.1 ABC transporter permease [Capsulimonas corticalis]
MKVLPARRIWVKPIAAASAAPHKVSQLRPRVLLPWLLPLLLLAVWQIGAQSGWIAPRILPAPTAVLQAGAHLIQTGELPRHIAVSSGRALVGFAIGGGIGFLLGLLNGAWPIAEELLDSTVQMLRTIPNLAMIPLIILWFGIGEEAKVTLVALGVFFPMYLNTYHGIRTADKGLKEMGRVYGLEPWTLFWRVIFPGAVPSILIGLRFALGMMWLVLIGAETLAADSGIGFMTTTAREFMRTDVVVLGTLVYATLGKLADLVAKGLERTFLQWHPNYQNTARF